MFTNRSAGPLIALAAIAVFTASVCTPAHAISIQFGTPGPTVSGDGVEVPGVGRVLSFPAQNNPSVGQDRRPWDTTAGSVILNVVPAVSATLTLTGPMLPNGTFGTFDITFDPAGGSGFGNNVAIIFQSGNFGPIGPPASDSASLDGIVAPLGHAVNPSLEAFAFGAGRFGMIGPLAPAAPARALGGGFTGALGPVAESSPPVTSLSGTFAFTFAATQAQGALVRLPSSAVVQTVVPEPSTLLLLGSSLIWILWLRMKS
jgi:hypothetical protein